MVTDVGDACRVAPVYVNADKFVLEGAPPAPPELFAIARPFVDRAVLRFKGVKSDVERIASIVIKARAAGDLSEDAARQIWWDRGHVLSSPVQSRYLEARQFALVDKYQRARAGFPCFDWPDRHAREALEGFVVAGEGALAAALALAHIERAMKSLRLDWRERRRGIPAQLSADQKDMVRATQAALIARIPLRNQAILLDAGAAQGWIAAYGTNAERAALDAARDEIERDIARHI
ncbi:MAG: hypothetical protein Q8R44_08970 [Novosphingobium sp.]|nr:hypothetical protein [Novosphingobium sp.]